jgi:hypothetical protein
VNVTTIVFIAGLTHSGRAQQASAIETNRIELGQLANGAAVAFVRADSGDWGIEISGGAALRMMQPKPAQIEVYRDTENVSDLTAGYQSVQKEADAVVADVKVSSGGEVSFAVEDCWTISGSVLLLHRDVKVTGTETNAGFYSAIRLLTAPTVKWDDVTCLIPGLLYGETHGGVLNASSKRLAIREDYLSAPLLGFQFKDGNWAAVLDPKPKGDTTWAETTAPAATPIVDEQIQFGAVGAQEMSGGGIELGFWLPGTTTEVRGFGGRGGAAAATPPVRRRYHPVKTGFAQTYQVAFRFGKSDSFGNMERDAWRWAWQSLNPKVTPLDIEVMRHALIDHLADRVLVVDDRAGIPFVIDSVSGKPGSFRPAIRRGGPGGTNAPSGFGGRGGNSPQQNQELADWAKTVGIDMDPLAAELELWPKVMMGFCGKNVEVADQLLQESDRDPSARGQRLRKLGTMIIESLVRIDKMDPAPAAEGFDIRTGQASAVRGAPAFSLRATAEDLRTMVDLIRRERARGRQHPQWFNWVKAYCDWLVTAQREDRSFPESFEGGTGRPTSTLGSTTYAAVPVLVRMTEETGDKKYLNSAIKAADYVWTNYGSKCVFCGATGGDTCDKESGMLSMEAFLALYENTKDAKWLDRAQTAGSYAESWIWIWNVPMPIGADYSILGWKPGVPTIGVNGIGSNDIGGVDEYLDWAVPSYAKLYKYTGDQHYLDVARVLLFGTKAMLALPGRTYDLKGPGWQQEHWRMGPTRGIGAHRTWLPWISVNHLHGITALEEFDSALYQQLAKGN